MARKKLVDVDGERVETIDIPYDAVNEQVVIAAACVDSDSRAALAKRLREEQFLVTEHRPAWAALRRMAQEGLEFDLATLGTLAPNVNTEYLASLIDARPDVPPNLEYHVQALLWDCKRQQAVTGPVAELLHALRDVRAEPERVRALARSVAGSFDGHGTTEHLLDPAALVREQMADIRERRAGRATYPYGVEGLDVDSATGESRLVPGAKPGQVTVITGVSGSGKSTFTARLALGLARQRRRVLFGAWEMEGGTTLELLACMSLGYSRTDLMRGNIDDEQHDAIEERMGQLGRYVRFMRNPFRRRRKQRATNEENLDTVQQYIEASGCQVFIADLWKRCLVQTKPEEEEDALMRQQAMAEETGVHCVLVQQQRLKDVEQRPDKRPTREGIKGSSAWVEVADTIIGTNRPALWRNVDDDTFEVHVLKQRYGAWPLLVEFDWMAQFGSLDNGRTVPYDHPGDSSADDGFFAAPVHGRGGKKRGRR